MCNPMIDDRLSTGVGPTTIEGVLRGAAVGTCEADVHPPHGHTGMQRIAEKDQLARDGVTERTTEN